ncbi:IS3 family transposase [Paenibacillus terrae]
MCEWFDVSRSGYYTCLQNQSSQSERNKRRSQVEQKIRQLFLQSRRLYGSRKIYHSLIKQGIDVSKKTVARIMKQMGMKSRTVKKYKATTNSKHQMSVHENHLNQQFSAQTPGGKYG